jgi:hypothetical protein
MKRMSGCVSTNILISVSFRNDGSVKINIPSTKMIDFGFVKIVIFSRLCVLKLYLGTLTLSTTF